MTVDSMTLGDMVTDNAARFPDVVAYRHGRRTVTHAQLRQRAAQLVSAMASAGVRRQDRIAVLSRNSIEFGELNAAIQLSGIIMATINFRLSPAEIHDALHRVSPSIVFCSDEFASLITDFDGPRQVSIGGRAPKGAIAYEQFLASGRGGHHPEFSARPDDIAYLLFTSGTTGAAKCCILGQREMRGVALTMNNEIRCGSTDRALITMPMFHVGALAIVGGIHARGGTVVLQQQFDAADAWRVIGDEQITLLHLAPVMLKTLLDEMGSASAGESIETVVYAAAPMTTTILRQALGALPRAGFLNLYGQTEVIVSGLPREFHAPDTPLAAARLSSVGFPFAETRVRIIGEDGRAVPTGQPGEIVVRSPWAFRGYWQDPQATEATLRNGWCHTGDVGRFDEHGLLYLVDRKKDVIVSGGENIFSPEVEDAVCALDGIAACAVVGVPDDTWGEAVCAVVVPRSGATVTLDMVQEQARRRLARFKVPRRLVLVDELPLLASGKVDKKALRTQVRSLNS